MARTPALILTPAARDQAIARLQDHYAQNDIDVDDFERRVEVAEDARTTEQLQAALRGLPTPPSQALVVAERAGQLTTSVRALLSSTERKGRWRVPSRVVVRATLGSVELDLVEAQVEGEVDIEVRATFGSVRIVVPEGLAIEVNGSAVLGNFDHLVQEPASRRDRRRVRVSGRALMGSVEILVQRKSTGLLTKLKALLEG
jgi:hypothetical protein